MKPAALSQRLEGVLAPAITPFRRDLSPDPDRFVRHCRSLLEQGCTGLAVFGTNSEANSLATEEKLELLDALRSAGVPMHLLMPGTGHCALADAVRMTREAVRMGCAGVLMLPPFYYKDVSDEGLYRFFSEVIERTGEERLRLYLYHIPAVAQVPITPELIERLLERYLGIVAGVKDSSGDWEHTKSLLERFAARGFDVFAGSELFLLEALRAGAKGCISATANVNATGIARVWREWRAAGAERLQAECRAIRTIVQKFPMIPALKAITAQRTRDPEWRRLRPPLVELSAERERSLFAELAAAESAFPTPRGASQ